MQVLISTTLMLKIELMFPNDQVKSCRWKGLHPNFVWKRLVSCKLKSTQGQVMLLTTKLACCDTSVLKVPNFVQLFL